MNRLAFIRRMALAAAACAFIDVPWPKDEPENWSGTDTVVRIGEASFNLTTGEAIAPAGGRAGIQRQGGYYRLWVTTDESAASVMARPQVPGEYDLTAQFATARGIRTMDEMRALLT